MKPGMTGVDMDVFNRMFEYLFQFTLKQALFATKTLGVV